MAYFQYYVGDVQVGIDRQVINQTTGKTEWVCTEAEFERAKVIIQGLVRLFQIVTPPAQLKEIVFDWEPSFGELNIAIPDVRFIFAEPLTYDISIHLTKPVTECALEKVVNQIIQALVEKLQERLTLWLQYANLLTETLSL